MRSEDGPSPPLTRLIRGFPAEGGRGRKTPSFFRGKEDETQSSAKISRYAQPANAAPTSGASQNSHNSNSGHDVPPAAATSAVAVERAGLSPVPETGNEAKMREREREPDRKWRQARMCPPRRDAENHRHE